MNEQGRNSDKKWNDFKIQIIYTAIAAIIYLIYNLVK